MGVCVGWVLMLLIPPFPWIYSWTETCGSLRSAWILAVTSWQRTIQHTGCADEKIMYREIEWLAQSHTENLCHFINYCNHLQSPLKSNIFPSLENVRRNITTFYRLSRGRITDHLCLAKSDAVANAQSGFLTSFVCFAVKLLLRMFESLELLVFH